MIGILMQPRRVDPERRRAVEAASSPSMHPIMYAIQNGVTDRLHAAQPAVKTL